MGGPHAAAVKAAVKSAAAPGLGVCPAKADPEQDNSSGSDDNLAVHEFLDLHQPNTAGVIPGMSSLWTCELAFCQSNNQYWLSRHHIGRPQPPDLDTVPVA